MRVRTVPDSCDPGTVEPSITPVVTSPGSEGGELGGARLARPVIVAYRKACRPDGTGLSHYLLMAAALPRDDQPQQAKRR